MLAGLPERAASGLSCRSLFVFLLLPWSLGLAAGCDGTPSIPGALVGESTHFRLFVDPNASLSPVSSYLLQGSAGLDALEADWADKQTMLKMPEGQRKIDYHLLTQEEIKSVCQQEDPASCELGTSLADRHRCPALPA